MESLIVVDKKPPEFKNKPFAKTKDRELAQRVMDLLNTAYSLSEHQKVRTGKTVRKSGDGYVATFWLFSNLSYQEIRSVLSPAGISIKEK